MFLAVLIECKNSLQSTKENKRHIENGERKKKSFFYLNVYSQQSFLKVKANSIGILSQDLERD
jgi:hypothetical protein